MVMVMWQEHLPPVLFYMGSQHAMLCPFFQRVAQAKILCLGLLWVFLLFSGVIPLRGTHQSPVFWLRGFKAVVVVTQITCQL